MLHITERLGDSYQADGVWTVTSRWGLLQSLLPVRQLAKDLTHRLLGLNKIMRNATDKPSVVSDAQWVFIVPCFPAEAIKLTESAVFSPFQNQPTTIFLPHIEGPRTLSFS